MSLPRRTAGASTRPGAKAGPSPQDKKLQLDAFALDSAQQLSTNQGVLLSDNHHSLKAGLRGPTLLEDFILREKITHFDHERIPDRAVHARGAAAHGAFKL